MKKFILLIMLLLALPMSAKKQSVGPARLKKSAAIAAVYDTIIPPSGSIRIAGYDKPNPATRETFFLTNNSADSIDALNLTIKYYDTAGRQLHQATHTVKVTLPPGETRNVAVPSWDCNNSFHYEKSPAPQRRQSTPYSVKVSVNLALKYL
ncbi:MAG: FxLYD domain-containing protein [Bacteroides sp.]|nr:FxLYD domain-containing protein [Bacteroides sp.]MCM1380143.1 FxLYD domain-containing protein [Bacteroides sp.]MCM1445735.1 FxLYD domain-containing protein [Prevotella sp.]